MGSPPASRLVAPIRPGEHACCRFEEAVDRERLGFAFLRDGLGRGDKVIYLCEGETSPVVTRLERLDAAFGSAIAAGQLEVRSANSVYLPDGHFDPNRMISMLGNEYERAVADGYGGLSISGDVPVALCEAPAGEQLRMYEARVESDHRDRMRSEPGSWSLLCQYDHGRVGVATDVIHAHQVDASPELAAIGRTETLAAAHDRNLDALRLAGELDFDSAAAVSDVLTAHFDGPLRLDLADLSYVDVAGMRALRGRPERRLTLATASDAVRRLVGLLGWDTDPDVELVEA
jgi:ABC-type transporter Mla MlaB component